ncbi:MAG: hypothetical protein J0653_08110 [Deltaproteobacteria bacterium]|nr:hypothetical protein [Deltaproteobacteria bacterium]
MSLEFYDVEGIPVTLGNIPGVGKYSAAWDEVPPRVFDPGSTRRNGAPVSVEVFVSLLEPDVRAWADSNTGLKYLSSDTSYRDEKGIHRTILWIPTEREQAAKELFDKDRTEKDLVELGRS